MVLCGVMKTALLVCLCDLNGFKTGRYIVDLVLAIKKDTVRLIKFTNSLLSIFLLTFLLCRFAS